MHDRKQPGCGSRDDVLEDQADLDEGDAPRGVLDGSLVPDVGPVLDLSLLQQKKVIPSPQYLPQPQYATFACLIKYYPTSRNFPSVSLP